MPGDYVEKAISVLLKEPSLSYLRELRRTIDRDPNYLSYFEQSVGLKIQNLLSHEGIYWDDEVFEKLFFKLVTEALVRLRKRDE